MIFWISGELISLITFPGIIVHEIAHRFFCDIFNVPVYEIHYFRPLSKTAGHVRHRATDSLFSSFFIGMAPLFINSLLCMILTFPIAITKFFGTSFLPSIIPINNILSLILYWVGFSIGFNAIPSKQDISGLVALTDSRIKKALLLIIYAILRPFNVQYLGTFLCLGYASLLSLLLPFLLFG